MASDLTPTVTPDSNPHTPHNTPMIVGLTGGIGSGKSKVSDYLDKLGASVIDTDTLSHQLTAVNGLAMPAIVKAFGPESVAQDGSLNRPYIRQKISQNPESRETLEAIIHPLIRNEVAWRLKQAVGDYVVLVVPLLIETGAWKKQMHEIVVVDCPKILQIERVKSRNGWPSDQILGILEAQANREERLQAATHVIENSGSIDELLEKAEGLHEKLKSKSRNITKNLHPNRS